MKIFVFHDRPIHFSLNKFILHRLRNKFLQLILISLDHLLPGNYTSTRAEYVSQWKSQIFTHPIPGIELGTL